MSSCGPHFQPPWKGLRSSQEASEGPPQSSRKGPGDGGHWGGTTDDGAPMSPLRSRWLPPPHFWFPPKWTRICGTPWGLLEVTQALPCPLTFLGWHEVLGPVVAIVKAAGENQVIVVSLGKRRGERGEVEGPGRERKKGSSEATAWNRPAGGGCWPQRGKACPALSFSQGDGKAGGGSCQRELPGGAKSLSGAAAKEPPHGGWGDAAPLAIG